MKTNISLRLRLTILTALIVTLACIVLTITLNFSAFRLLDSIAPTDITPAAQLSPAASIYSSVNTPAEIVESKMLFKYSSINYMLLIILGSTLITYIISGKALEPISDLSKKIKEINENNLSQSLSVPSTTDEIAQLTKSFNEMLKKIDNAFLVQKQFSANAAHELRTPLAVIRTKIDVFKKRNDRPVEDYNKLINVIEKNSIRLSEVVDNLLALSKMDNIEDKTSINLYDLVFDISNDLKVLLNNKNVSISISNKHCSIKGNYLFLYRAFYNLIENAIKYNVENGYIEIDFIEKGNMVDIYISDSGIGIPNEYKDCIFDPFFRVDKSRSRNIGGSGLGLSIVKTIIDKHNGSISLEANDNNGCCFIISLPF